MPTKDKIPQASQLETSPKKKATIGQIPAIIIERKDTQPQNN